LLRLGVAAALPGEIVNLATGRLATIRVFAETAAKLLQLSPRQLEFGALPKRAEEMHHGDVAVNRLKGLLGWMPTTGIVAGIRRTLAFHNELVRNVPAE
jgi:nucleoside-diphosphate-sugar epimerase